jgi:cysteine desulfurase / selenocysteine lyase
MSDFAYIDKNPNNIYLDSASTTLRHKAVVESILRYSSEFNLNLGRTFGAQAYELSGMVKKMRMKFCELYNCPHFYLTSSATDSLNQIAIMLFANNILDSDSKLVLAIDNHHAAILPFVDRLNNYEYIYLDYDYNLDIQSILELTYIPDIIVLSLSSNVTGSYLLTEDIKSIRTKFPFTIIVLDGTQYLASKSINFEELEVDFVVGSFHKMYGPSGYGFVMYNEKYLNIKPARLGGGIIKDVTEQGVDYLTGGDQFESGTLNLDTILSIDTVLDFLQEQVYNHSFPNLDQLLSLPDYQFFNSSRSDKTISFRHKQHSSFDLANYLAIHGITVRVGSHCANPLIHYLKVEDGLVRVSLGVYTTQQQIDKLVTILNQFL